jgi:hypothetical protein
VPWRPRHCSCKSETGRNDPTAGEAHGTAGGCLTLPIVMDAGGNRGRAGESKSRLLVKVRVVECIRNCVNELVCFLCTWEAKYL